MLIPIPISTDAPIYHFPYATIGLIVLNALCFAASGFANPQLLDYWVLEYGNGINPVEWFTASFSHGGWTHLVGNMVFLWGFGLLVEGKLGWRRFLKLYLSMVVLWGAGVDFFTLHRTDEYVSRQLLNEFGVDGADGVEALRQRITDVLEEEFGREPAPEDVEIQVQHILKSVKGRCLGASGVIFGLMAISLVWAPKNEVTLVIILFFRAFFLEVSILWYSLVYFILNVIGLFASRFEMGTSGLHLVGVAVGLAAGTLYVKKDWVNCENWDLFAVLRGDYGPYAAGTEELGRYARVGAEYNDIPLPQSDGARVAGGGQGAAALDNINSLIDRGDFIAAAEEMVTLRMTDSTSSLDRDRLRRFSTGLIQANMLDEAEAYLDEFVQRFPDESAFARLRLAQLLLQIRKRPRAAYATLRPLMQMELTPEQKTLARRIAAVAKQQIDAGVADAEYEW